MLQWYMTLDQSSVIVVTGSWRDYSTDTPNSTTDSASPPHGAVCAFIGPCEP